MEAVEWNNVKGTALSRDRMACLQRGILLHPMPSSRSSPFSVNKMYTVDINSGASRGGSKGPWHPLKKWRCKKKRKLNNKIHGAFFLLSNYNFSS